MNLEVLFAAELAVVMFHQVSCAGCLSSRLDVAAVVDADVDVAVELRSVGEPQEGVGM